MWSQKIKTLLFPILGLDLEPETPESEIRIEGDLQPTLAFLVARGPQGTVFVEATPSGELKTAPTGSGLENVEVSSGTATDSLVDLALVSSFTFAVIKVKNASLSFTFETSPGTYSSAIELAVGDHVRDMSAGDMQVANQQAGNPSTYEIEAYR
jgi:hypothetical protein